MTSTPRARRSTHRRREGCGINFDPSHFCAPVIDPVVFIKEFGTASTTCTSRTSARRLDGALDPRRPSDCGDRAAADFVSPGHGDVDFEELFRALNRIGYDGPLSIEWEDSGMDREWGRQDALRSCGAPTSLPPPSPSKPRSEGVSHG